MQSDNLDIEKYMLADVRIHDDVIGPPVLEVEVAGMWVEADPVIFASWTGLRRKNGEDYHDRVVPYNTDPENGPTYTGKRMCPCSVCQSTVSPAFKMN